MVKIQFIGCAGDFTGGGLQLKIGRDILKEEFILAVVYKRTIKNSSFLPTQQPWQRIQDVQKIITDAKTLLEEILGSYDDISAIGLTGQMHGIAYVDRCGKAVSPLYTWQDGCGNLPCFDGRSICDILAQDYGVSVSTGYGMVTYLYHSRQGLVPRNAVSFCTVSDYLGMELTGSAAPLVHISQAAGMRLFAHKSMDFSREILAQNGADPGLCPGWSRHCPGERGNRRTGLGFVQPPL